MSIHLTIANNHDEFLKGRELFEAYAASLDFNLCFQGFDEELNNLASQYQYPEGALIIAYDVDKAVGVVAVRKFAENQAELKRMYTMPEYRGKKIGFKLLEKAIEIACELGYQELLLDTLPKMKAAIKLYEQFGFIVSEPYRYNPFEEAIYMKKVLANSSFKFL